MSPTGMVVNGGKPGIRAMGQTGPPKSQGGAKLLKKDLLGDEWKGDLKQLVDSDCKGAVDREKIFQYAPRR